MKVKRVSHVLARFAVVIAVVGAGLTGSAVPSTGGSGPVVVAGPPACC